MRLKHKVWICGLNGIVIRQRASTSLESLGLIIMETPLCAGLLSLSTFARGSLEVEYLQVECLCFISKVRVPAIVTGWLGM